MDRNLPAMPPHIASLPRERGYPVPWVSDWPDGVGYVESHPTLGRVFRCTCAPGQGRASLGVNCAERQRQGMRERLCGVCGRTVTGPFIMLGIASMNYSFEPPVHSDCGMFSLLVCPRLVHSRDSGGVVIMDDYLLIEERLIAIDQDGQPIRRFYPPGWGALAGGVLNFYIAVIPPTAERHQAAGWLAANRHLPPSG